MEETVVHKRRETDHMSLKSLSQRWSEMHPVLQWFIALSTIFTSGVLSTHQALNWLNEQAMSTIKVAALEPRVLRVERLATQDSMLNLTQAQKLDTLEKHQFEMMAYSQMNRALLEEIRDGVLRSLCRQDKSAATCDAESLDRRRNQ